MNRLIDKTLNSLFKLAERLTGTQAQPTTTNSKESALPKLINGFKANYLINHIEGAAL